MKNRTLTLIANEIRGLFDASAEPTLEVLTGKDSFNQAIAAGAQAADLLDGDRDGRLTVNTNGVATVFHLDVALDRRLRVNRVILDGHTLRKAYGDDVGNLVKVLYNSTDNYGTATEAAIARVQSRLLAHGPAYLDFNGVGDYVEVADNADFTFGNSTTDSAFSVEAIVKMDDASGFYALTKYEDSTHREWALFTDSSDKLRLALVDESTNDQPRRQSDSALTTYEGEWIHILATYDGTGRATAASGITLYVNGVAVDSTAFEQATYVAMEDTSSKVFLGRIETSYAKGGIDLGRVWNRELTAAEALTRYAGWTHTPIPAADQGASQTAKYASDYSAGLDGWANTNITDAGNIDNVSDGVTTRHNCLRLTMDAGELFHAEAKNNIVADTTKNQSLTFIYYILSGQSNVDGFQLRSRVGGEIIWDARSTSSTPAVVGTWTTLRIPYLPAGTTENDIVIIPTDGALTTFDDAGGDDIIYIAGATLYQTGCVAEWGPEGISPTHGKWHDRSGNGLHGTITGAEARDVPSGDEGEVLLIELEQEIGARYWYLVINPDGLTGDAHTLIGQMPLGRATALSGVREFDEDLGYPGIDVMEAYGGSELPSVRYEGERGDWSLVLVAQDDAMVEAMRRIFRATKGTKKTPLYLVEDITLNDGRPERLIYCVKFDAPLRKKRTGKYHEIETALREVAG